MRTRSLTEGAMLGALTVLLTIIGEYIGFPALIVPVPLMLLVYRQGYRWGVLTVVVAALVTGLVAGHVFSGLSIIIWGVVGVAVGMALREKFNFPKLMLVAVASNLVVVGLNMLLYALIIGGSMYGDLVATLVESIEQAMQTSINMGLPEEALAQYELLLEVVPQTLKLGLPAILLVSSVGMSYINLAVLRLILKRLGDELPWIAPFDRWRLPRYFAFLFFFGWFIYLAAGIMELPSWLKFLGVNLFLITYMAYLITGLSLAWFYFRQRRTPGFIRGLFVLLLFTTQFLLLPLILLTVADSLLDLRRLIAPEAEEVVVESADEEN